MARNSFCVGFVFLAWVLVPYAHAETPLTPAAAVESIGKPCIVVEMTVRQAKNRLERRGIVYLDSEDDFQSPTNLGVAISASAAEEFRNKGIEDPAAHFLGKTIRVSGNVMRFEDRVYLPVLDASQICLVPK